ncbi:hypothetical protein U1Q18_031826 [Sarracenia purpurea var. burkii]
MERVMELPASPTARVSSSRQVGDGSGMLASDGLYSAAMAKEKFQTPSAPSKEISAGVNEVEKVGRGFTHNVEEILNEDEDDNVDTQVQGEIDTFEIKKRSLLRDKALAEQELQYLEEAQQCHMDEIRKAKGKAPMEASGDPIRAPFIPRQVQFQSGRFQGRGGRGGRAPMGRPWSRVVDEGSEASEEQRAGWNLVGKGKEVAGVQVESDTQSNPSTSSLSKREPGLGKDAQYIDEEENIDKEVSIQSQSSTQTVEVIQVVSTTAEEFVPSSPNVADQGQGPERNFRKFQSKSKVGRVLESDIENTIRGRLNTRRGNLFNPENVVLQRFWGLSSAIFGKVPAIL